MVELGKMLSPTVTGTAQGDPLLCKLQDNTVSKFDAYPRPRLDELQLGMASFYSTLDLTKHY